MGLVRTFIGLLLVFLFFVATVYSYNHPTCREDGRCYWYLGLWLLFLGGWLLFSGLRDWTAYKTVMRHMNLLWPDASQHEQKTVAQFLALKGITDDREVAAFLHAQGLTKGSQPDQWDSVGVSRRARL